MTAECRYCSRPATAYATPHGDAMRETATGPVPVCPDHIERAL